MNDLFIKTSKIDFSKHFADILFNDGALKIQVSFSLPDAFESGADLC